MGDLGIPRRCRKALFDIIDIDGSGTVTSSELQEMLLLVKEPVHAHEMMGCHFRVRDIQRQLQTRIEPQLASMSDFNLKCMEENECLLEDLYLKVKDIITLSFPERTQSNAGQMVVTPVTASATDSTLDTSSVTSVRESWRSSRRRVKRIFSIQSDRTPSDRTPMLSLVRGSSALSAFSMTRSASQPSSLRQDSLLSLRQDSLRERGLSPERGWGPAESVAGDIPLPPVLE